MPEWQRNYPWVTKAVDRSIMAVIKGLSIQDFYHSLIIILKNEVSENFKEEITSLLMSCSLLNEATKSKNGAFSDFVHVSC